jgi:hypothetical protein
MPSVAVELEPGRFLTSSDSAGLFQFTDVPTGRYLLRFGYSELADSVTLGSDGLVVLVVAAEYINDIVVRCTDSSAPSRRPPNGR